MEAAAVEASAEAAKLALEYVLEVHDDLEDWQRMDPTLAQALDEGLSHCLDAMQSLVLLYQAMRDIEDDQLEAPPEVTAEADAHVEYLNSMLASSPGDGLYSLSFFLVTTSIDCCNVVRDAES